MANHTVNTNLTAAPRPPNFSMSNNDKFGDVKHVLTTQVTPVICLFGVVGNLMNLAVLVAMRYAKPARNKDSGVHLGLVVLALSDLFFCIVMSPRGLLSETETVFFSYSLRLLYQVYSSGLVTTFMLTSTWLTVAMAVMRYIAICHPFRSRMLNKATYAKFTYLFTCLACVLFNMPSFWQYKISQLDFKVNNETAYLVDIGYFDHKEFKGQLFIWLKVILGVMLPVTIMSFCNCSLIRALRKSYRIRLQSHVSQDGNNNRGTTITLTLIIIIIAFVLFVFPSEMMDFSASFVKSGSRKKIEIFLLVRSLTNTLQVFNFSFNFVLYCIINVHFRQTFLWLVTCGMYSRNGRFNRNRSSRYGQSNTTMTLIMTPQGKYKDANMT